MEDVRTRSVVELGTGATIERIVVPITLDHEFDRGVSFAARLAARWGLDVRLVSVDLGSDGAVPVEAGRSIHAARKALVAAHPDLTVDDLVIDGRGDPTMALVEALEPCDLVVLATAHAGAATHHESFAQMLAHDWGGPVLMVGPQAGIEDLSGDVVVGVDGSVLGERGLPVAVGLAAALGVHLWVVQVVPQAVTQHIERLKAQGEKVSESGYIRDVIDRLGVTAATWEVVHGDDPAKALASFADDRKAALLVMATHGESGLVRPSFGSVAMTAVQSAHRPVVVIRPTAVPKELSLE